VAVGSRLVAIFIPFVAHRGGEVKLQRVIEFAKLV
jgi:hypothetical protein